MTTSQFPITAPAPPPNALDKTPGANPMAPESASAAVPPPPKESTVKMQNPTGGIGDVPEERVSAATAAGYQPVVQMTNPGGNAGYVPTHKAGDALKAGYKYGAPISDNSTIGPSTAPSIAQRAKSALLDPFKTGALVDAVTEPNETLTQEGRGQHPIRAAIGDVTRGVKDLLTGEQGGAAGKSEGTSSGLVNNPISQAMMIAPDSAAVGGLGEEYVAGKLAARTAAEATRAAEAAKIAELTPEHFTYREPTATPQHGTPVKAAQPLDNATIDRMPGGKDLSPEAKDLVRQHVGGEAGQEIQVGSSPKNTLVKAVAPMHKAITETGLAMNDVISKAAPFKSSTISDPSSSFLQDITDLRDNLPLKADDPLNKVIDTQVQAAYPALESTDPAEVLAARRKLGTQIDWNNIVHSPETAGEAKNLAQSKIYNALGNKIHAEIPQTAELDKVFQPNLELQSHLDAKLGRGISRDPLAANAEHLSELKKGQTQIANEAHNAVIAKNRRLAGMDSDDVQSTIGSAPGNDVTKALDKAVGKFTVPASEQPALRQLLQSSVKAGRITGTNTSWYDGLKAFDNLSDAEKAARFSNPTAVRAVLRAQTTKQWGLRLAAGLTMEELARQTGLTGAAIHALMSL